MRRLTTKLAVASLAIGGGYVAAQMLAPAWRMATSGPDPAAMQSKPVTAAAAPTVGGAVPGLDGDELLRRVADTLERRPNVAAKVRQSLRHGDHQYAGEGAYWQHDVGNQRRTRWQLVTLMGSEKAYYTQIFDGDRVWTDRQLPLARTITRLDLQRLRRELGATPDLEGEGASNDVQRLEVLARGGLAQLVAELERTFTFDAPYAVQGEGQALLAIVGRWRPEHLADAWPDATPDDLAAWPPQLPHHVLVHIGASDLFPRVVEYRGADQAALASETAGRLSASAPMASYEFIDVQWTAAMPDRLFEPPAQLDWQDVTAAAIDRLRRVK